MNALIRELGTRLVPWERIEITHAWNRPLSERPPIPRPGDRVWYRRYNWDTDDLGQAVPPELVVVIEVQPVDDTSPQHIVEGVGWVRDPNLWHLVRDTEGHPIRDAGHLRYAPVADPWPWLSVRRPNGIIDGCREARVRGSAGWLPLDYETRPERWRLPADFYTAVRPALPPLNVPLSMPPRPAGG